MISLEAIYLQVAFSQPDLFSIQVKHKGEDNYKVIARDSYGSKLYKYEFRSDMEIATGYIAAGTVSEFLSRDAKDFKAYCGRITINPTIADRVRVAFEGHTNALCNQDMSGYWDHNRYDYLRKEDNTPIRCDRMIPAEAFNNNSPTLQVANILKDSDTDIESESDEDVFYRVNKPQEEFTPTDIYNLVNRSKKDIDNKLTILAELCNRIADNILSTGKLTHTSIDSLRESVFNNASWVEDNRPIKEQMESLVQNTLAYADRHYQVPTQRFPCGNPLRPIINANGFYLRPLCYVDFVSDSLEKIVVPEAVCFSDAVREDIFDICNDFKHFKFEFDPNHTDIQSLERFLRRYKDDIGQPEVSKILCLSPYDSDELNHEGISWYLLSRWDSATYIGHRGIEFNYAIVVDSINSPKSKQLIRDGQMIDPFLFPESPSGLPEAPEEKDFE